MGGVDSCHRSRCPPAVPAKRHVTPVAGGQGQGEELLLSPPLHRHVLQALPSRERSMTTLNGLLTTNLHNLTLGYIFDPW